MGRGTTRGQHVHERAQLASLKTDMREVIIVDDLAASKSPLRPSAWDGGNRSLESRHAGGAL
jgi:hypothetical protein